MAPGRELENGVVIVLSNGPAIIVNAREGERVRQLMAEQNRNSIMVVGRLTGEHQDSTHTIFLRHVVRISPYVEPAPETESVGRATVEKPSERPDGYCRNY